MLAFYGLLAGLALANGQLVPATAKVATSARAPAPAPAAGGPILSQKAAPAPVAAPEGVETFNVTLHKALAEQGLPVTAITPLQASVIAGKTPVINPAGR